jgi:hypothetical protein
VKIYRDPVLFRGQSAVSLLKQRYSAEQRTEDKRWSDEYRAAAQGWGATKETPKLHLARYYDGNEYVGLYLAEGKPTENKNLLTHPFIDGRGIGFKVFLEFRDFQKDLRAGRFLRLAQELAQTGFRGDLKVQIAQGTARFKFNNIVVHAGSRDDAYLAEKVGVKFFAQALASIGRGVDVDVDRLGKNPALDWSDFLCMERFDQLPDDAKAFVQFH